VISVANRDYHHLSQFEIARGKRYPDQTVLAQSAKASFRLAANQAQLASCGTVGSMETRSVWTFANRTLLVLGVLAFGLVIFGYAPRAGNALVAREATAQGIVTAQRTARFYGYYYDYLFSVNGQSFTGRDSQPQNDFEIGNQVVVYYDSQNPKRNALTDFAEFRWDGPTPYGLLIFGVFFLFLAGAGTLTGEALARGGVVYRTEEPKEFWWVIAIECLGGVGLIGYFLYLTT